MQFRGPSHQSAKTARPKVSDNINTGFVHQLEVAHTLWTRMGTAQFLTQQTYSHSLPRLAGATVRAC